jgi:hypothetical protein
MVREGTRRCDLCASEILGHGGADICVVCRISREEAPEYGLQAGHELEWEDTEAFALDAIVGTSPLAAGGAVAANDETIGPRLQHVRRSHARKPSECEGMVQRFAAGLRSISRRGFDAWR